jgi:tRNA U55 pseudouridine synthase TruB
MIHLIQVNKRMEDICSGILLVDKQEGETSFDVVKKVRKASGVLKVGHTGTLDPFATGLLVVLLGEVTKLSPFLMAGEKHYQGTIRLGIETDTLESHRPRCKTSPMPPLKHGFIRPVLSLPERSSKRPQVLGSEIPGEKSVCPGKERDSDHS